MPLPSPWCDALEFIRAITAQDPGWDSIGTFIDELRLLAEQKRREHQQNGVHARFAAVLSDFAPVLDYLGNPVDLQAVDTAKIDVETVEALAAELASTKARIETPAPTFAEEIRKVDDLRQAALNLARLFPRPEQAQKEPPSEPERSPSLTDSREPDRSSPGDRHAGSLTEAIPAPPAGVHLVQHAADVSEAEGQSESLVRTALTAATSLPSAPPPLDESPPDSRHTSHASEAEADGANALSSRPDTRDATEPDWPASAKASPPRESQEPAAGALGTSVQTRLHEAEMTRAISPRLSRSAGAARPSLSTLDDDDLAQAVIESLGFGPSEQLADELCELQTRAFLGGDNLCAFLAAHVLETERGTPSDACVQRFIPSTLCRLAVGVAECHTSPPWGPTPDVIGYVASLSRLPLAQQRFLVAWLTLAVTGSTAESYRDLARNFPVEGALLVSEARFPKFCIDEILGPAARGKSIQIVSDLAPEQMQQRAAAELTQAKDVIHLAAHYKNMMVKRCWIAIAGRGGPVQHLLERLEAGDATLVLPSSADQIAGQIDDWQQVKAAYRSNIQQRLDKFLEHANAARRWQAAARGASDGSQRQLDQARIVSLLADADRFVNELHDKHCPSAHAFALLRDRLSEIGRTMRPQ